MKLLTSPTNDSKNGKEIVDLKSFSEKLCRYQSGFWWKIKHLRLDDCVLRDWLLSSVKQGWIEGFLSVSMKLFPLNIKVFW